MKCGKHIKSGAGVVPHLRAHGVDKTALLNDVRDMVEVTGTVEVPVASLSGQDNQTVALVHVPTKPPAAARVKKRTFTESTDYIILVDGDGRRLLAEYIDK